MKAFICACVCVLFASLASAAPINLIANGDFSAGNCCFTSDYAYVEDGLSDDDLWGAGTYGVDDSTSGRHSLWVTQGGDGNALLVNGRSDAASTVWRQSVSVEGGRNYSWSAWAANLCCLAGVPEGVGPTLEFFVNGLQVGSFVTDGPGVWQESRLLFTAASTALAVLEIRNVTTLFHGNDFALDTLTLTDEGAAPEPASMLLLGSGLLGIGAAARRKRQGSVR